MSINRVDSALRSLWRPRDLINVALPLIVVLVLAQFDLHRPEILHPWSPQWQEIVHYAVVLVAGLVAISSVRVLTRIITPALTQYLGLAQARRAITFLSLLLYSVIIILTIQGAGQNLSGLLVGGAVTGVIVGIAGQASLSNLIAGLVILFVRPYSAGSYLTVRAMAFGGVEYSGQVWDISLFYTTMRSEGQEIRIPNSTMVTAVVVARPRDIILNLPITLPRSANLAAYSQRLRRAIMECVEAERPPHITLLGIGETTSQLSIRIFLSNEAERTAVEQTVAAILQESGPVPPPETEHPDD